MSNESPQTLGQKIDAVLEPLYLEAEQYRQTIAQVTAQREALQEQIDQAQQGLGQIESRMAQVVRELAQQEPVIAAVVGQRPAPIYTDQPDQPATPSTATPEAINEESPQAPAEEPEQPTEQTEPQAEAQGAAPASSDDAFIEEEPYIELDPEADAQTVGEAASLLGDPPAPADQPVGLAEAAQRAAAAAKQLRDKAASN